MKVIFHHPFAFEIHEQANSLLDDTIFPLADWCSEIAHALFQGFHE